MKDEKIIRRAFEIAEKEASGDGLFRAALKAEIAIHKAVELARRDERKRIVEVIKEAIMGIELGAMQWDMCSSPSEAGVLALRKLKDILKRGERGSGKK